MPRRRKIRFIEGPPSSFGFKPKGIPARFLKTIILSLDEYESIKLVDYYNLEHEEASKKLGISRSVFTRNLDVSRKKIAKAIVEGCELSIEGGDVQFEKNYYRCLNCFGLFENGREDDIKLQCPFCNSENVDNLNSYYQQNGKGHHFRRGQRNHD
jgi:predicted DNA-binding protein (UPF0251 family)